ncbi:Arm repeat superfamily protein [Thalictrum thalictroides]|uniref:Arm repeat superfamily protein n=1 Tax=Thalictrum thalictroides TaxID=46969 RepID=A0A7J6VUV6_THATH|nr:Arm repeat superfamily protein [Thalictrum thalictroides]
MKIPENHQLVLLNQLISSLIEQIPLIKTFKGKWSVIKNKLNDLHTQLNDLSDFPSKNFSSNSLSSELLLSISQTLTDALSLADKCIQDPILSAGKLRTQSDIDSISAKLDQHIKDSDLLIRSGVLLQDTSISNNNCNTNYVSLSTTTSKREIVRVEARNLITRLQIGNSESKNTWMDSLLGLLHEDDKNVLTAVAQGVVPVLVRLFDSSCLEIKEKAVSAISRISTVDSSKHVLVAEGILLLNHLIRVIESGSGFAKEKACIALQALSFSKENAIAIGSRGGISSLLEICQSGTHTSQAVAAGVLRNLALFGEIKMNFVDENGIPVLIALSASGTALAQENSIGCLCNLVAKDEKMKLLVVKEGGIKCFVNFWDAAPMARNLEVAVGLLLNLASCRLIAEVLVSNGFIARLIDLFKCGVSSMRIAASRAVYELGYCTKTRKEIGEAGFIPLLVKMLDAKAAEEKDAAAKALSCLMQYMGNRRILRKEDRGIAATVQLLDPSIHNLEKEYPILILLSIAQSKKCRRQMIDAGAGAYLQKLVEMEVEGCKKLLECLGRGKLWGVFART